MSEAILAAALSRWNGLYQEKLFALAEAFGSLGQLHEGWRKKRNQALPNDLQRRLATAWSQANLTTVKEALATHAITSYIFDDPLYPPLLKHIPDKPYVLYAQGDIGCLHDKTVISCVGTRTMSLYGRRAVSALLAPLGGYPICLVSGLALGIDGEVHRTALGNEIKTAAVLAGGLDGIEPRSHTSLANQIRATGCLLSEYPPGVRPQRHSFLERNRLIAGLAQATIIVEGTERSGALVTARAAAHYGREVGAVPGDIFHPGSAGPHQLLQDGAWPLTGAEAVLAMVGITPEVGQVIATLSGPIYTYLKTHGPSSLDVMANDLSLPVSQISQELTHLEIRGSIGCTAAGEYYLTHLAAKDN